MNLTKCSYKPMEEDEDPGMPSFEVEGQLSNRKPFKGVVSVELDGRDADWTGSPKDLGMALADLCELVGAQSAWAEAEEAHGF